MSEDTSQTDGNQTLKIQSLREMITNAEKTIQGAKAMLLQIEGKKKVGRHRKLEESSEGGSVVQGTFDGQIMFGSDGKQYPVPANYASKSKLVEGDLLKLHITQEGSFIYKQIGPAERKHALGIVTQDAGGNYVVIADGKPYRILLASVTYFKAQPGDEAAIVTSRDIDSHWASLENIVQKAKYDEDAVSSTVAKGHVSLKKMGKSSSLHDADLHDADTDVLSDDDFLKEWQKNLEKAEKEIRASEKETNKQPSSEKKEEPLSQKSPSLKDEDLLEEWRADIEAIEKEIADSEKLKKVSAE